MRLTSISYSEFPDGPQEWRLDGLKLHELNLIVGKNASGKTRSVNVIWSLARILNGVLKPTFSSSNFAAHFEHDGSKIEYVLRVSETKVTEERVVVDGKSLLKRGAGGAGEIWASKLNQPLEFQAPENEAAAVVRRDQVQHAFLEPLHTWAQSVLHYAFGSSLGKDRLGLFIKGSTETPVDGRDPHNVVGIFHRGLRLHKDAFKAPILRDMKAIGYDISDVGLDSPPNVSVTTEPPGQLLGLYVQETSRPAPTRQFEISQGMFRALSLFINLTFAELELNPSCIIIDDIGEGLDFSRSCALIDLLMTKAGTKIQLVMTSNDRFVMNRVPLQNWTVLTRDGTRCQVNNYENSKKIFDEFNFTGLNNFDFFSTDFITTGGEPPAAGEG